MIRIPEYLERRRRRDAGGRRADERAAGDAAAAGTTAPSRPGRLTVLIAPDSFKGSLTSIEVARALATGWRRARPDDDGPLAPLADGGEGTLVAIEAAGGWEWQDGATPTTRSGGRSSARWLRSARRRARGHGARRGVRPVACRAGRAGPARRDDASGPASVLRAVLDAGVRHVTLGLGGSATTDGGTACCAALGARP